MQNGVMNGTIEYIVIMNNLDDLDAFAKKFYKSPEWKALRSIVLETRNTGRCRNCQVQFSDKKWCEPVVDHILPLKIFPECRLEINNLQVLCNGCNYAKASTIDGEAGSILAKRKQDRLKKMKYLGENLEVSYINSPVTLSTDKEVKAFVKAAKKKRREEEKNLLQLNT